VRFTAAAMLVVLSKGCTSTSGGQTEAGSVDVLSACSKLVVEAAIPSSCQGMGQGNPAIYGAQAFCGFPAFFDEDPGVCPPPSDEVPVCCVPDYRGSCNDFPCSPGEACFAVPPNRATFDLYDYCTGPDADPWEILDASLEGGPNCGQIYCLGPCTCTDAGASHCSCQ
jgi:hypothetical protein